MVILNYSRRSITFLKPLTNYLRFFGILPDYDFETKTLTNSLIYPISSCVTFVAIVFLVTVDLSAILANVAAFGIEIFQVCEILTHFFGVACLFWCRYDCHVKRKVWEHFLRSMAKIESKEYLNADDTEQNFCLNPFVQFVSLNVLLLGGYVARFAVDDYYNDIGFLGYLPLMIFSFENMLVSFVISSLAISFKNKLERINELLQNCVGRESLEVDEVRKAKSLYLAVNKLVDEYNNLFGKQLLFMPLLCLCKVLTVTLVVCFRGRLIRFASNILHILFAIFMMVLAEVRNEFLNFENTGMSITEISHRSSEYSKINNEAQNAVKQLLSVPDNYKILFLPGGGQGMFSAIAMNLMNRTGSADYVVAGIWSGLAAKEAAKYGTVNPVFPKPGKLGDIPDSKSWTLNPNASYLYYCDNETIEGIEFPFIPETRGSVPIVVDMASNIMTRKFDVSKFGLIFAPVQKNLGTAGVVLAIIRDDLLGTPMKICPSVLNFTELANTNSILNTPPIFQVYVTGKILQWINIQGGLKEMEKQCCQKSQLLYNAINQSNNFYECHVPENFRSRINVSFKIGGGNDNLEEKFVQEAEEHRIYQLRGHRLVGGIRVSLYNAVSYEDTETLVQFMKNFQAKYQNSIERHL